MRGTIDKKKLKPKKVKHLLPTNAKQPGTKKEQIIFDKFQEIQRENRILLKKMLTIDMKGSELNPRQFRPIAGPAAYSLNRGKRVETLT